MSSLSPSPKRLKDGVEVVPSSEFIDRQLLTNPSAVSLNITSLDFSSNNELDKAKITKLVLKILSDISEYRAYNEQSTRELEISLREKEKLKDKMISLEEKLRKCKRRLNLAESEKQNEKEKFENEKKILKRKVKKSENEISVMKGKEFMFKKQIRKDEFEIRKLKERLNAKFEKSNPDRFKFCINSDKVICDFRAKNDSIRDEKFKTMELTFEVQIKQLKKENYSLRNSLFNFKDSLLEMVEQYRKELNKETILEKCVLFDLNEDYSNLPFSAFGDLFTEGIKATISFIKEKLVKQSVLQPTNITKSSLNEDSDNLKQKNDSEKIQMVKNNPKESDKIRKQLEIILKQQLIIENEKENAQQMLNSLSEIDSITKIRNEMAKETKNFEKMSQKLHEEQMRFSREREEFENQKRFWLSKFDAGNV